MDRYVAFMSTYLSSILLITAFGWLVYRSSQVLSKPADELINLLGLDVPVAPILSLAAVKADGLVVHWKAAEQRGPSVDYRLLINGITVGEILPQDPTLSITGLKPGNGYIIRIQAVNSQDFGTASEPLRILTKSASSGDFFASCPDDAHQSLLSEDHSSGPMVRPYRALFDSVISQGPAPVQREHSGSFSQQKRAHGARRHTQPSSPPEVQFSGPQDISEPEEAIIELNERLDKLREEKESYESQVQSEKERYKTESEDQSKLLKDVQQALQDKSNASRKLNQQVSTLSSQESSARRSKGTIDRKFQQITQERQKMTDDLERWDEEKTQSEENKVKLGSEGEKHCQEIKEELSRLDQSLSTESGVNKSVEETIREAVVKVKELDEQTKIILGEQTEERERNSQPIDQDEHAAQTRAAELQAKMSSSLQQLHQLKMSHNMMLQYLDQLLKHAAAQQQMQPSSHIEFAPPRRNSQRSLLGARAPSLRNELSSGLSNLGTSNSFASVSGISPNYPSSSPFFNISNGLSLPPRNPAITSLTDIDNITGCVPTSPSAGALLPSGLLGDDSESKFGPNPGPHPRSLQDSPSSTNILPGLGAPETLVQANKGPSSPASAQSRSPTAFASPRESLTNLGHYHSGTAFQDSDRRSIRSTAGSARAVSGGAFSGTKFANLFQFNRQRGKTLSDEGPQLGTLRTSESQSFPREDLTSQDPIGTKRRGSHSGNWMNQMLNRNTVSSLDESLSSAGQAAKRKLNVFGSRTDPWNSTSLLEHRTEQSRPSTASSENNNALPKPTAERPARFGWTLLGEAAVQRTSPLGADWSVGVGPSWFTSSRNHSRTTSSSQYGALGLTPANELSGASGEGLFQAPIGTSRPSSSSAALNAAAAATTSPPWRSAKLNPAAPSFKLFSRSADKRSDKADKPTKSKEKDKDKDTSGAADSSGAPSPAPERERERKRPPFLTFSTSTRGDLATNSSGNRPSTPTTSSIPSTTPHALSSPSLPSSSLDSAPRRSLTKDDNASLTAASDYDGQPHHRDRDAATEASLDRVHSADPPASMASSSLGRESFMARLSRKSSNAKFKVVGLGKGRKGSSNTAGTVNAGAGPGGATSASASASPVIGSGDVHTDDDGGTATPEALVGSPALSASSPGVGGKERFGFRLKRRRGKGASASAGTGTGTGSGLGLVVPDSPGLFVAGSMSAAGSVGGGAETGDEGSGMEREW